MGLEGARSSVDGRSKVFAKLGWVWGGDCSVNLEGAEEFHQLSVGRISKDKEEPEHFHLIRWNEDTVDNHSSRLLDRLKISVIESNGDPG